MLIFFSLFRILRPYPFYYRESYFSCQNSLGEDYKTVILTKSNLILPGIIWDIWDFPDYFSSASSSKPCQARCPQVLSKPCADPWIIYFWVEKAGFIGPWISAISYGSPGLHYSYGACSLSLPTEGREEKPSVVMGIEKVANAFAVMLDFIITLNNDKIQKHHAWPSGNLVLVACMIAKLISPYSS